MILLLREIIALGKGDLGSINLYEYISHVDYVVNGKKYYPKIHSTLKANSFIACVPKMLPKTSF